MAILNKSTTSSEDKDFWATSNDCFRDAVSLYGREFIFDVCAEELTSKCGYSYFNKDEGNDSLQEEWPDHYWCNPPFSQKIDFISKAKSMAQRGIQGMLLLPYEPLTTWWQSSLSTGCIIYEPNGRYNFMERDGVTMKKGVNFGVAFVVITPMMISESIRVRFRRGIHKLNPANYTY